jgi:hypothetical protein
MNNLKRFRSRCDQASKMAQRQVQKESDMTQKILSKGFREILEAKSTPVTDTVQKLQTQFAKASSPIQMSLPEVIDSARNISSRECEQISE